MDIFTKGIVWEKAVDLAILDLLFCKFKHWKFQTCTAPHYPCLNSDAPAVPWPMGIKDNL